MIIPIQNNNDDETPTGNVQEWALIELNGELVPPLSSSEKPPQSQEPNENNILKDTVELGSIEMRKVRLLCHRQSICSIRDKLVLNIALPVRFSFHFLGETYNGCR